MLGELSWQYECKDLTFMHTNACMQALGPVALVSLLLSDGLVQAIPGSDVNTNPNQPANPRLQAEYNRAAIQVLLLSGNGSQVHGMHSCQSREWSPGEHSQASAWTNCRFCVSTCHLQVLLPAIIPPFQDLP